MERSRFKTAGAGMAMLLALWVALAANGCSGSGSKPDAAGEQAVSGNASIPETSLIHAQELAPLIAGPDSTRPLLWHVGYEVLYKGGHIPGSRYIGPGSKPEGIAALREALQQLPAAKTLVLYCGCCPWSDCPNMKPAYAAAVSMGRSPRILYVAKNFQTDWADLGLPTASGE